ncbi:hypothetical protein D9758_015746 [Tetrapyrgos nigripes]|uniref:Heterokaryon incompatibility domain-containing protein n=1 Tax=Tetrapyrgos nigripes TaxID=182062 RepID=A0A8H5FID3_9AGAR|nr:hypothetical protein D9758_015746 [Tetrapyrgos nigripes]
MRPASPPPGPVSTSQFLRMSAPGMSADSTAVTTPPLLDPLQKRARPRRLVNACTIEVEEFPSDDSVPPYAILSHCWKQGQEVSYQEMVKCQSSIAAWLSIRAQSGYKKIVAACRQAREDNHTYIWIDTCCIDKGDHGQQSQDINSMFDYYKNAKVCYVYLNDYDSRQFDLCNMYKLGSPPPPLPSRYPIPCWFFSGWTLQELVAPSSVEFFDAEWKRCGDRNTLSLSISYITGIRDDVLGLGYGYGDMDVGIVERMSWAIHRQTTKEEDRAYCLLGLLDVTMEPRYGEGIESAFERLSKVLHERYSHRQCQVEGIPKNGREMMKDLSYRIAKTQWSYPEFYNYAPPPGNKNENPNDDQDDAGSMSSGYWGKHPWKRLKRKFQSQHRSHV